MPKTKTEADLHREVAGKWQPKKARSEQLAAIYQRIGGHEARAGRVRQCGDTLVWRLDDDGAHLHQAYFCKDRLCPMCAWRRSLKMYCQVSQVMDYLAARGERLRYLFLTLTVRSVDGASLSDTVRDILMGWRRLYHDIRQGRRTIKGAIRAVEVTRNSETGSYHPHIHVILAVAPSYFGPGYIQQPQWVELWRTACGLDYDPVIDVRTVKPRLGRRGEMTRGLQAAVAEISKYACKDSDYLGAVRLPEDEERIVLDLLCALTGHRRLVDFLGIFRQARAALRQDDVDTGDMIHVDGTMLRDDLAYILVTFGWRCGVYVRE